MAICFACQIFNADRAKRIYSGGIMFDSRALTLNSCLREQHRRDNESAWLSLNTWSWWHTKIHIKPDTSFTFERSELNGVMNKVQSSSTFDIHKAPSLLYPPISCETSIAS